MRSLVGIIALSACASRPPAPVHSVPVPANSPPVTPPSIAAPSTVATADEPPVAHIGDGWEQYAAPLAPGRFAALSGSAADDVWLLSDTGLARWNGHRWSRISDCPLFRGPVGREAVLALWVAARDDVWVAGPAALSGNVRTWHWHSGSWTEHDPSDRAGGTGINSIRGSAPDDLWAVSLNGWMAHWDGSAWTTVPLRENQTLTRVFAPDRTTAFYVGMDFCMGVWDGHAWRGQEYGPGQFNDLGGTGPNDVWAVGSHEQPQQIPARYRPHPVMPFAVPHGFHGSFSIQHWDGHSWTINPDAPADDVMAVAASAPNRAWALDAHGQIWRWDGTHWTISASGSERGVAVWVAPTGEVWVTASAGTVVHHAS